MASRSSVAAFVCIKSAHSNFKGDFSSQNLQQDLAGDELI